MTLGFSNTDDFQRAGELLRSVGYDYDSVCALLGGPEWITLRSIDLPRFARRLSDDTAQHTLIRLLLLGMDVSAADAERALRPMSLASWIEAGVLRRSADGSRIAAALRLTPFPGMIVAADRPQVDTASAPPDFVMPPGGTSLELGWSAVPGPADRALDLGTGSGYLGLVLAQYCRQVTATDRNERAVQMATFNARLNGVDHFQARPGSSWEPVAGEQFDRVLANPPFVITPHQRLMFRDSGVRGDEFCRRLIREAPRHLCEGGFCQMLGNFGHRRDGDWPNELASWFEGLGCDALVFVTRQEPIDEYAMHWITTTESQDPKIVPRMFDEWMQFYDGQRIEQVSYLHINLRRRAAGSWVYVERELVQIAGPAGESIVQRFATLDALQQLSSAAELLDWPVVLDGDARLAQLHGMSENGPKLLANRLEMHGGLRYSAELDGNVMRLLAFCDGRSVLRELLSQMAQSLNLPAERVNEIALPVIRHLLERGFLRK